MIDPISNFMTSRLCQSNSHGPLILMYHATVPGSEKQKFIYSINAPRFERQLDFLQKYGWHTACVRDLLEVEKLPGKTVILTFDDGFANNYEGAFLPLVKRNMKATWFITSGCIGSNSTWLEDALNDKMLTKNQLREMHSKGMEIGSHTVTHPDLTFLKPDEIEKEIYNSKNDIEKIINAPVSSFAYPYGRYNKAILNTVKNCGYLLACSVRSGRYSSKNNKFELPRITIFASDSVSEFARKLVFAANEASWSDVALYYFNRVVSRLKSVLN